MFVPLMWRMDGEEAVKLAALLQKEPAGTKEGMTFTSEGGTVGVWSDTLSVDSECLLVSYCYGAVAAADWTCGCTALGRADSPATATGSHGQS